MTNSIIVWGIITGIGATLLIDLWAIALRKLFNIPSLDYKLVGRWLCYMLEGRFIHNTILSAESKDNEQLIGWTFHFVTGAIFGVLFLSLVEPSWLSSPSLFSAVAFGFATVSVPFCVMQPGLGFGFAAAKMPKPWSARLKSVSTHGLFGVGLYLSATFIG